jgi:hypothetical protein
MVELMVRIPVSNKISHAELKGITEAYYGNRRCVDGHDSTPNKYSLVKNSHLIPFLP